MGLLSRHNRLRRPFGRGSAVLPKSRFARYGLFLGFWARLPLGEGHDTRRTIKTRLRPGSLRQSCVWFSGVSYPPPVPLTLAPTVGLRFLAPGGRFFVPPPPSALAGRGEVRRGPGIGPKCVWLTHRNTSCAHPATPRYPHPPGSGSVSCRFPPFSGILPRFPTRFPDLVCPIYQLSASGLCQVGTLLATGFRKLLISSNLRSKFPGSC